MEECVGRERERVRERASAHTWEKERECERERETEQARARESPWESALAPPFTCFSSTWACPMQIGLSQECCLFCLKSSLWSSDLPCLLATAILDSFSLFYSPNIPPSRDGRPSSLGIGASRSFWLLPAELGQRGVFSLFYLPNSLFCIRFWLLGDKNQVLFISMSPVPSM